MMARNGDASAASAASDNKAAKQISTNACKHQEIPFVSYLRYNTMTYEYLIGTYITHDKAVVSWERLALKHLQALPERGIGADR